MTEHTKDNDFAIASCSRCQGHGVAAVCPTCDGAGGIVQFESLHAAQRAHEPLMLKCPTCNGRGQLPISYQLAEDLHRRGAIPSVVITQWPADVVAPR